MISIPCPACGRELSFDNADVGKSTACPHCQQTLVVPASAATTVAVPELQAPVDSRPQPKGVLEIELGGEAQLAEQTRATLRRRLILIAIIVQVSVVLFLINATGHPARHRRSDPVDWLGMLGTGAAFLSALAWLLARPKLSLGWLRTIEALFFGWAAVGLASGQYRWYHSNWFQPVIPSTTDQQWKVFSLLGESFSLPWFLLIILYGVCIPNTGRRAAWAVAALAAVPLTLAFLLLREESVWQSYWRQEVFPVLVFWLAVGAGIAIYGSNRIRVLEQAASASRHLGRYVLKRLLGTGGMGEVYLAEHRLLKRPCAVKLIRPEKAGDQKNLARFQREVQAIVKLSHPNVVHVYDYGQADDGTFYYAMEYLEGMDLEQMVRRHGPLPPERVVHLLRQIAGALKEAHACGLVHRDIKPGNIIVCNCGGVQDVAKLVDFGIVREEDDPKKSVLTRTGVVLGSPLYMSPEQIRGAGLDGRSDLYSLALVGYYLLTGTNPFRRPSPPEVFSAHLHESAPRLDIVCPAAGPQLGAAIMRCLEKSPEDRCPDAESFERALADSPFADRWTDQMAEAWWRQVEPQVATK